MMLKNNEMLPPPQEEKTLDEMNTTMQKGKGLVKQTEEVLSQLMSSLEEVSPHCLSHASSCKSEWRRGVRSRAH